MDARPAAPRGPPATLEQGEPLAGAHCEVDSCREVMAFAGEGAPVVVAGLDAAGAKGRAVRIRAPGGRARAVPACPSPGGGVVLITAPTDMARAAPSRTSDDGEMITGVSREMAGGRNV